MTFVLSTTFADFLASQSCLMSGVSCSRCPVKSHDFYQAESDASQKWQEVDPEVSLGAGGQDQTSALTTSDHGWQHAQIGMKDAERIPLHCYLDE